jgi:polyisoprenyl-teichoic acid--peptidoglycan teichoic acid transferase
MGQSAEASAAEDQGDEPGHEPEGSLWHALGLTAASAVVWGVAHLVAGRRVAGFLLMALLVLLLGGAIVVVLDFRDDLQQVAVQRDWLFGITIGILVLALLWAAIVVRSYLVVRPRGLGRASRVLAVGTVFVLVMGVCTPLVWAARDTYTLRDTIGTIFHGDDAAPPPVVNPADRRFLARRLHDLDVQESR